MIKIEVGKPATECSVHKDLLCHHSSYFRGALNGNFEEARSRTVVLDEDDAETFSILASWIYSGRLYDPQTPNRDDEDHNKRTTVSLTQQELVNVWVLGDARGIPMLQNEALNSLHKHIEETQAIDQDPISTAFDYTPAESRLREYFVTLYGRYGKGPIAAKFHEQFVRELCDRLLVLKDRDPNFDRPKSFKSRLCEFHVHDEVDCSGREVCRRAKLATAAANDESDPPDK